MSDFDMTVGRAADMLASAIAARGADAVVDALDAHGDHAANAREAGTEAMPDWFPHLIDGLREAVRTVDEARRDDASVRVVSRPGTRVTLSWARNEPPSDRLRHIAIDAVNHAFRQTGGTP